MDMFPIQMQKGTGASNTDTDYIPLKVITKHENQAQHNHSQSLEELARRGGLSYCEALAVLQDRPWYALKQAQAKEEVYKIVMSFKEANSDN